MSRLTDLFGADADEWMTHPGRWCAHTATPDLWFQPAADMWNKDAGLRRNTAWAKELCTGCPVSTQCLTYAIENNEQWGVWGGTTANERAAMLKRGAA